MSWLTTAAIILVPWGYRKYAEHRAAAASAPNKPGTGAGAGRAKALSTSDYLYYALCVAIILHQLWTLLLPTFDAFETTGVALDAPAWVLRNALAAHLSRAGYTSTTLSFDDAASRSTVAASHTLGFADRVVLTFQLVRSSAALRGVHAAFGAATLLGCAYCRDPADYWTYAVPAVLAPYAVRAAVLGVLTAPLERGHWRATAVTVLAAMAGVEALVRFDVVDLAWMLGGTAAEAVLRVDLPHRALGKIHAMVTVVLVGAIAAFPRSDKSAGAAQVLAEEVIPALNAAQRLAVTTGLAHAAVMGEPEARAKYVEVQAAQARANDRVRADASVAAARREAAARIGLGDRLEAVVKADVQKLLAEGLGVNDDQE
ncbi:hypothetical protein H9P43_004548 [Blastocladiella emersonii ATCC 22665]|nr:hypothetical protein H9P43_004548 [Blastocladiella emersonii ATCC 22665]